MALVHLNDKTPGRISACPVHFLWDGQGRGRLWVRAGFLGLVVAGMLFTAEPLLRSGVAGPAVSLLARVVAAVAAGFWAVGQAVRVVTARRASRGR